MNIVELMARSAELMPLAKDAVNAVDELIAASDNMDDAWHNKRATDEANALRRLKVAVERVKELRAKLPKDI